MSFEPPKVTKTNCSSEGGWPDLSNFSANYMWPGAMAIAASKAIASSLGQFARYASGGAFEPAETGRVWTTQHQVRLELSTMELRDFSATQTGVPALICAPFALHYATIADFAPGHSVVEALCNHGVGLVYLTDWRSAGPEMRFLSIDSYLADLNVAVDELGPPVDLIGLCQGGWLALVYAARFPHKVRRLVLVGAPVDIAAGLSGLSRLAVHVPLAAFEHFVDSEGGRVHGRRMLHMWGPVLGVEDERRVLQVPPDDQSTSVSELLARFREWNELTVDLPGTYYLQVVSWLYKENRVADGRFTALGRRIDLASLYHPIFLLAARDDELVAPDQLFAVANRIGTPKQHIEMATEPCGHLSLFLGADTIKRSWIRVAGWLGEEL
jgi:poly(3-hydroxyalkanoate) synthetase